MINVGDTVFSSRHGYAKVTTIEIVESLFQGNKYGVDVKSIPVEIKDNCIFDLDNGHWSYGYETHSLEKDEESC